MSMPLHLWVSIWPCVGLRYALESTICIDFVCDPLFFYSTGMMRRTGTLHSAVHCILQMESIAPIWYHFHRLP